MYSWCATKVEENGFSTDYGFCGPDCLTHEEAKRNWKTDETFKMTLQYDNSDLLWAGLQLYGNLLAGILSIGLALTTLLPAIGKIMIHWSVL